MQVDKHKQISVENELQKYLEVGCMRTQPQDSSSLWRVPPHICFNLAKRRVFCLTSAFTVKSSCFPRNHRRAEKRFEVGIFEIYLSRGVVGGVPSRRTRTFPIITDLPDLEMAAGGLLFLWDLYCPRYLVLPEVLLESGSVSLALRPNFSEFCPIRGHEGVTLSREETRQCALEPAEVRAWWWRPVCRAWVRAWWGVSCTGGTTR
ncbi:hypothetical protein Taro_044860 [Colocasia esculenta]|uniref:Uncharacterized protein n=1 Tax=Colocasia esculenta TaxID=4460 RepID=A0A843X5X1_COLES|nr:hypothetical protein [Colocasia esculenta]